MQFESVLTFAHRLIRERVHPGDIAIDATVGTGRDTLLLARQVGERGSVYGFDIQPQALAAARERLMSEGIPDGNIRLFPYNHASMLEVLPGETRGQIAAVAFNLGYLPGGDRERITTPEFTIQALEASIRLLRNGGVITVVAYTGHPGGQEEADAVCEWAGRLPQERYQALQYRFTNQRNHPPFLLAIEKISG